MRILRSFTIIAALAGASTALAEPKQKEAPAKAPAKEAKPPPKAEVTAAEAERFLGFFNKFVDTVVATKDDCPKMATAMNKLIDKNQPIIRMATRAKAAGKDLPAATKEKMMGRAMKELVPAMQKCGADPKVQAALKRIEDEPAPAKAPPPAKKAANKPANTK